MCKTKAGRSALAVKRTLISVFQIYTFKFYFSLYNPNNDRDKIATRYVINELPLSTYLYCKESLCLLESMTSRTRLHFSVKRVREKVTGRSYSTSSVLRTQ